MYFKLILYPGGFFKKFMYQEYCSDRFLAKQIFMYDDNVRQSPEVYDLCHTFFHVVQVKKHTAMRESHAFCE